MAEALPWVAFWIFLSVFVVCDTWLYSQGHNTFFWSYKTEAEKEIQKQKIKGIKDD